MFLSDSLSLMVVSVRLSLACFSSVSFSFNELSVAARAASAASRLDLWIRSDMRATLFYCFQNLILSISAWASTNASKASARLRSFIVVLGEPLSLVAMPLSSFCTPER